MTIAYLAPALRLKSWTSNGQPNAFGSIATYSAGTVIPVATYVDNTGTTQNLNPIQLDNRGEASVWLLPNVGYKLIEFDSAGNQIHSTDQVTISQLLSLNGGVDTGSPSLYILTFASPFTTYSAFAGTPIFWIPSSNNIAAPSINVNGIGVVGLYNANGTPLGANQILANLITEIVYQSNIANSGNSGFVLLPGGTLTGATLGTFGQEVPLSSAATTDLGSVPAHTAQITGTTTITSFGTSASVLAPYYLLRFSGAMTLTNSTSLQLPGNANITTTAGDSAIAQFLGTGNWRIAFYQYATGSGANSKIKPADTVLISSTTLTPDPDLQSNALAVGRYTWEAFLIFDSVAAAAGFKWTNDGTALDSRTLSPAIVSGFINGVTYGPKSETPYGATLSYGTVSTGANSNMVLYKGSLLVSTPGTFGVSWAQAISTASNTTLRAGSYLTLNQVNTGTSSSTVTRIYITPGSFVETVPVGFNTLTIEAWGATGGGGQEFVFGPAESGGGGASSGSYARTVVSVTGLGGDTLNFTVGAHGVFATSNGGASSVSSGTLAITTMTAPGGIVGGNAVNATVAGSGGPAPANATGGTAANIPGNSGQAGANNAAGGQGGQGGFGISGINGGGNIGGLGNPPLINAGNGRDGIVIMSYAP